MQTFLPRASYKGSAMVLDRQRLGKQRVEGLQLLNALSPNYTGKGWVNHPAARMWRGHEGALARYVLAVCEEWVGRGYMDTCADKVRALMDTHPEWTGVTPPWFGDEAFHRAHRSNLVRKAPEHYAPLFEPGLPADLPYLWPTTLR
jgi:hypothetical protein